MQITLLSPLSPAKYFPTWALYYSYANSVANLSQSEFLETQSLDFVNSYITSKTDPTVVLTIIIAIIFET